jgi:predicted transcriptional regulator
MTRGKINQYGKDLNEIEKNIGRFRDKVKNFADGAGKEGRLLKDSTVKKTRDVLNEIEKTLNKMEERIKRQRQMDKAGSA